MADVKLNEEEIKTRFGIDAAITVEDLVLTSAGQFAPPGHIFHVLLYHPESRNHYIQINGFFYLIDVANLDGCWEPLPFFHRDIQTWMIHTYARLKNKYKTPNNTIFRYPDTKYPSFVMSTEQSEAYEKHLTAEASLSDEELSRWANAEHFCGYLTVKDFYPDHVPDLDVYRSVHGRKSDQQLES